MKASLTAMLLVLTATFGAPGQPASGEEGALPPLKEFLKPVPPMERAEAMKTIHTLSGFHLELTACEPMVTDPIAGCFDEDGRLYIGEMNDYPYQPKAGEPPLGKVRLLEDADGDGKFEKSTIFAGHLLWPSGIAPWKGGVFVAAAPDLWYLKDTDGDRIADEKKKIYTGFGTGDEQGAANNLIWGLDHKIYGSGSKNGGTIRPADRPEADGLSIQGQDFRFDPVTGQFEAQSGGEQFGNTFDDWGNRFICDQSKPAVHVVLPQHYLARNPNLPVARTIKDIAEGGTGIFRISPLEAWRVVRSSRRIATNYLPPASAAVSHDVVTSGAGVTVYRGAAYPKEFQGNLFTGCSVTHVVHRRKLLPDGATFKAVRADQNTEFVRSTDIWFRPVNLVSAPDGTLYILDMYREYIESVHLPLDVVQLIDLKSGRDRGRIYRIAPVGFQPSPPPRLSKAGTEELVAQLENPDGWWRDTAHRLLYERKDPSAAAALRRLLGASSFPPARLHALWSLHGLGALSERDIAAALSDPSPGVREHALRLAEPLLNRSKELLEKTLALAGDPEARVEFQAAFTLGEAKDPRALNSLARIAKRHAPDFWMRAAVLSSVAETAAPFLRELLADPDFLGSGASIPLLEETALLIGLRGRPRELEAALAGAASPACPEELQRRLAIRLGEGLRQGGGGLQEAVGSSPAASKKLGSLLDWARQAASSEAAVLEDRQQAVRLLACGPFDEGVKKILAALLSPQQPQALQLTAVRALGGWKEAGIAPLLLESFAGFSPPVREQAVEALLAREESTRIFLEAVEKGPIPPSQLKASWKAALLDHRTPEIQAKARNLLGGPIPGQRREAMARYQAALALPGEAGRGEKVYEQHCSACHPFGQKGYAVGPNLAVTKNRTPEALLAAILDPNQEVQAPYIDYLVIDRQGRVFTGLIAEETVTSVTLKRANDERSTILRKNILQITATGMSLMPEGLEEKINFQDLADLIAFILGNRYDLGTDPGAVEPEGR
ncbi:MAG: HEAT repeat domain-containing protein [Planctomycetes bacterium]|nr:HEAT repeat domain-containing protein [Planctomycetota bacterium]